MTGGDRTAALVVDVTRRDGTEMSNCDPVGSSTVTSTPCLGGPEEEGGKESPCVKRTEFLAIW